MITDGDSRICSQLEISQDSSQTSHCSVAGSAPAQSGRCRCSVPLLFTLVFLLVMPSDTFLFAHSPPEPPQCVVSDNVDMKQNISFQRRPVSGSLPVRRSATRSARLMFISYHIRDAHVLRIAQLRQNLTETIYPHRHTQII